MSNNFHKSMADKFNKKKTINNDISRLSNIHKKTSTSIPITKNNTSVNYLEPIPNDTSIYKFNNIKSVTLNLDTSREIDTYKIPKIQPKDIIITNNSIDDTFEMDRIYQNKFHQIDMQLYLNIKNSENKNEMQQKITNETLYKNTNDTNDTNNTNDKNDKNDANELINQNNITDNKNIMKNKFNNCNKLFNINFNDIKPILNNMYNVHLENLSFSNQEKIIKQSFTSEFLSNNIFNYLSSNIDMNIDDITKQNIASTFLNDKLTDINIQNIYTIKNNVKKIYHIYQEKYANYGKPTGFGDFIRSCIFIVQFCFKNNINYDIIINHPIALFLNKFYFTYKKNTQFVSFLHKNTNYFSSSNWLKTNFNNFEKLHYNQQFILSENIYNDYLEYLSSLPVINNSLYSYNILFPIDEITSNQINIMKDLLEPTNEMTTYVHQTLNYLNFINNRYIVVQIRSGDKYLNDENNNVFLTEYLKRIYDLINTFNSNNNSILLIADNNKIKHFIHKKFPQIKILFNNITHIGECDDSHEENLKNTLLDFYLMSKSCHIFSITSYLHGSGFSYWCSKIYSIPYNCIYIEN